MLYSWHTNTRLFGHIVWLLALMLWVLLETTRQDIIRTCARYMEP